jgi:nitronate monooxygenase
MNLINWNASANMSTPLPEITTPELLAALNELLEAERAGARVARETAATWPEDDPWREVVLEIQSDELRWCKLLMDLIHRMNAKPSALTGAFHAKAMGIPDQIERMRFLNRGQAWVVRRLEVLLAHRLEPQVREGLKAMRDAHAGQIERVTHHLST